MEDHLSKEVRMAKYKSEGVEKVMTIENIEQQEEQKHFYQWLESQT
jgi:hypothetical protein